MAYPGYPPPGGPGYGAPPGAPVRGERSERGKRGREGRAISSWWLAFGPFEGGARESGEIEIEGGSLSDIYCGVQLL